MTPSPDDVQADAGYLEPAVWVDALKDAAAIIRCIAAEDDEGRNVIVNGNSQPRAVTAAIALIALHVCRRGALSNADIDVLLADIKADLTDRLLDQNKPAGGGD
jgi:histidine ammonia-lyase